MRNSIADHITSLFAFLEKKIVRMKTFLNAGGKDTLQFSAKHHFSFAQQTALNLKWSSIELAIMWKWSPLSSIAEIFFRNTPESNVIFSGKQH